MKNSLINLNINVSINNINYTTNNNYNIIQVCNLNNINIPKFCYHEELSIAGNCRMCLVEVKGINKPIASCAIPIANNMVIYTNSKLVKKAREGILEFILINHPLDCPICDQGGECDLQDQSLIFGSDRGRFYEYKRSVNDKDCGPFIKTIMTRCIHCTRCVRFLDEVSGFKYLGLIGRGQKIEISNFINKTIYSELSGNIVDLCPVGALTLKTYSFKARPWELNYFNTIDLNDPFHLNIRVDLRDSKILRILPIYNNIIKENWITDLTRYCYDGYTTFRLLNPLLNKENKFISYSWINIIKFLKNKIKNMNLNFILGNFLDMETSLTLKKIINNLSNKTNITLNSYNNNIVDFRNNYLFEKNIIDNLSLYDNIILVNLNIRYLNPLLNLKLKTFSKKKNSLIFNIGSTYLTNFNIYNYSSNLQDFFKILEGKSELNNFLIKKKTLIILDNSLSNNIKNNFIKLNNILDNYFNIKFSFLNSNNNQIIFKEINLNNSIFKFNNFSFKNINKNNNNNNLNYFINTYLKTINLNSFNIYQGHNFFFDKKFNNFNLLLPSVNYLEKISNYVNFFGYYQKTKFLLFPPKNSRNDWKIIYILFKVLFNLKLIINSSFLNKLKLDYNLFYNFKFFNLKSKSFKTKLFFNNILLKNKLLNFYRSNQILYSSTNIFNIYKKIKENYSNFY